MDAHDAARRAAYGLLEGVQTQDPVASSARVPAARREAVANGWADVALVLDAAAVVDVLLRSPDRAPAQAQQLVAEAEVLCDPALLAMALAIRALVSSGTGDTVALLADASRAVALLEDESSHPADRCAGYVIAAAAVNTQRLWELVDTLYSAALVLGPDAEQAQMGAAVAVNRVLTRLEWACAALEVGLPPGDALAAVLDALPAARAADLSPLWRADVEAAEVVVGLLQGTERSAQRVRACRDVLCELGDVEVLPLLDAAADYARCGQGPDAAPARTVSFSSGSATFPLWVRAHTLAEADPGPAAQAAREYGAMVARAMWESRRSVLAATRAQIDGERRASEHTRLRHAVHADPLTGLQNRRVFDAWLREPGRQEVGALVLLDIDRFKEINDTFGHGCGDEVLRQVAGLLGDAVRPDDVAIRQGGDEFALLLRGAVSEAVVRSRMEQTISHVRSHPWDRVATGLRVTVTGGMAVASGGGHKADLLYRAADRALYKAKRLGGGRLASAAAPAAALAAEA